MVGRTIGNYEVQRLLADGGMGQVYLAWNPAIRRHVAIKVLSRSDAKDPEALSRFITEARAANAIRHPNIVEVLDSGVLDDGAPYLVMEYLQGQTLTQALARGLLPIDAVVDWSCQTAEALMAAHEQHIVHRDLKPDNLFLVPDLGRPGRTQVKVLDFGIAKLQSSPPGDRHRTRTGAILGTPTYMSPEQCLHPRHIDARSDVYSFGVILYEMVTGVPPFDSESVYTVMHKHIHEPPAAPSSYRAELPPRLEAIILQALAKQPAQRQGSMAQLLTELELVRSESTARPLPDSRRDTVRVSHEARAFGRDDVLEFLHEIDGLLPGPMPMEIVGGAAALLAHGAQSPTKDINSFGDFDARILQAAEQSQRRIPLHRAPTSYVHGLGLYDDRRLRLYLPFDNLVVWVPDRYDLFFMKSARASPHDLTVLQEMHAHIPFDLGMIMERYNDSRGLDRYYQQLEMVIAKLFGETSRHLRRAGYLTMR